MKNRLMMEIDGNTSTNNDGISLLATMIVRLAFRCCGEISPNTATRAAVWLFTKPKRSAIRDGESQLLNEAKSYFLRHRSMDVAVMEWGSGPAVLCLHGWSSRGVRFKILIERLVKSGYRVVAFDAPAHGRSSGSHIDVMGYAETILGVAEKIGGIHTLIAHSFGAAATLLALEKGLNTQKAVFFSALNGIRGPLDYLGAKLGFSDQVLRDVKHHFENQFNRDIESLEAVNIVPRLETPPLLIVHDKDDPLLPFHNALDLAGVWKNSQLLSTQGIGHEAILDNSNVIQKVIEFLNP